MVRETCQPGVGRRRDDAAYNRGLIIAPQIAERLAVHAPEYARPGVRHAAGRRFGQYRQFLRTESIDEVLVEPDAVGVRAQAAGPIDEAARMLAWRAAYLSDSGRPYTLAASQAKYYASEVAVRAANAAVQVHGGYGYVDEFPVQKYLRDARVSTLYEGTSQIQKLLIGRALTGESAFA